MGAEGDGAGQGVFGEVVQGGGDVVRCGVQQFGPGVAAAGAAEFVEIGGEGGVHQGTVIAGGGVPEGEEGGRSWHVLKRKGAQ